MFKNFLIACAELLNRDDLLNEIKNTSSISEITNSQLQNDILRLTHYFNHASCALAEHYLDLVTTETITSNSNSEIEYYKLSSRPLKILSVTDELDHVLHFKVFSHYAKILHQNKPCKITYKFLPNEINDYADEICHYKKSDLKTISYAVVSEFFASKELFQESNFWKDKFFNELQKFKPQKERRLKSTF